jgi:gamma-glutamylcyclotransferase (GGCT)/AIG2-like uncharacterized protein YtfP
LKVFVYGTLKPGECNYPLYCQNQVIQSRKVYTYGQLYHLNQVGYPGMTEGDQKVYGYVLTFTDETPLPILDKLETYDPQSPPQENEYDRRLIPIYDLESSHFLEQVWGYVMRPEKVQELEGIALPSGWWTNPGREAMFV